MRFGPVPVAEAEGAILAHSVPLAKGRLRKGRVLTGDDLTALAAAGRDEVIVARPGPGDVAEDEAAARVARALVPDPAAAGLRIGNAGTGRVNLFADAVGVVEIEAGAIRRINAVDPAITVATVPEWQKFGQAGGMAATIKIIPYAVPEAALAEVERIAPGAMRMRPVTLSTATLIQTVVDDDDGEKGQRAIGARCDDLGVALGPKVVIPHRTDALAEALGRADADLILILTGSATSDPHDVGPEAVRRAGGTVERFGMPVDPGNLLFLGALGGRPVIGLPGCARSPALNGADWVMERVICGVPVTGDDIAGMGVGGLLKDIPQRGRMRTAK